ncbi:MAG: NYN domain-containing protein [Verrucomicrobiaceae bacterium]|nr:MAG: NYN domain-containing protein [Verrucomicrobiaceae bacterium]
MSTGQEPFNTAVFYDIENLLGGYNFNAQLVADLSLKEIRSRIQATGLTGRIAVQRAYANWSDPRLGILRNEINELGIDPIQVFGFSRDAKRNAADIQLAIDAVDLAHLRPAITNFVIVSGDGGFASLAKKLHEYGRTVIGAAYRKATNQTLRAVCDDFVWIEAPDYEEEPPKETKTAKAKPVAVPASAPVSSAEEAIAAIPKISMKSGRDAILATARKVIEHIAKAPSFQRQLDQDGIPSTVLGQALRSRVEEMDYSVLGFPKLTDLLRYLCTGTNWQIARRMSGDNANYLIRRKHLKTLTGWESFPDLTETEIHGEEYYRSILSHGMPIIRIDDPYGLRGLLNYVSEQAPSAITLATAIESGAEALQGRVPAEQVRQGFLILVNVGAFLREPQDVPLAEQKLTLREDWGDPENARSRIVNAARGKIIRLLGKVDESILGRIL